MKLNPMIATALMSTLAAAACKPDQRGAVELVEAAKGTVYLSTRMLERFPIAQQHQFLGPPGSDPLRVRALVAPDDLTLGPRDAPVVLIAFVDLAEGAGSHVIRALQETQAAHPQDVRVVLKPVGDPTSAFSQQAARSVAAAITQGKGWELALCLAELDARANEWGIAGCADTVGVDSSRYEQDLADATIRITEVAVAMRSLAVTRTPTLFLNGFRIKGLPPAEVLERGVALAIREATTFAAEVEIDRSQVYPALMRTANVPAPNTSATPGLAAHVTN